MWQGSASFSHFSPRQATKVISKLVNTAPLAQAADLCTALCCLDLFGTQSACIWCLQAELLGLEGAINVQGEVLQHFDRIIKRFTGMEQFSNLGTKFRVQRWAFNQGISKHTPVCGEWCDLLTGPKKAWRNYKRCLEEGHLCVAKLCQVASANFVWAFKHSARANDDVSGISAVTPCLTNIWEHGKHQTQLECCRFVVLCGHVQALRYTGKLGTMASEEEDMPVNAALSLEERIDRKSWDALGQHSYLLHNLTCPAVTVMICSNLFCVVFIWKLWSTCVLSRPTTCSSPLESLFPFPFNFELLPVGFILVLSLRFLQFFVWLNVDIS